MWGKASAVALLALSLGYLYHTNPHLPAQLLSYVATPATDGSKDYEPSAEQVIATAWETLITLPSRQWSRVAVG